MSPTTFSTEKTLLRISSYATGCVSAYFFSAYVRNFIYKASHPSAKLATLSLTDKHPLPGRAFSKENSHLRNGISGRDITAPCPRAESPHSAKSLFTLSHKKKNGTSLFNIIPIFSNRLGHAYSPLTFIEEDFIRLKSELNPEKP